MSPEVSSLASEAPTQDESLEQVRTKLVAEEQAKLAPTAVKESAPVPPEEGEEPESDPELPVDLPENWETHEQVAERLKAAENEGYNRAKSHLTRAHAATLAEVEATYQDELQLASNRAISSQVVQTFSEALGDLDLDDEKSKRDLLRLLHANESWARVFFGNQERDAQATLVNLVTSDERWTSDLTEEASDEFNATVRELNLKLRASVARAENRNQVNSAYADALTKYLVERDKLRDAKIIQDAIAAEKARLEGTAKKVAGLTEKAQQRDGKSPPAKPTGAAGSGHRTEEEEKALLLDPKTPIKIIQEIRARQQGG